MLLKLNQKTHFAPKDESSVHTSHFKIDFDITGHAHSVTGSQNGDSGHYSIGHYDPNNIVTNPLKKKVYHRFIITTISLWF